MTGSPGSGVSTLLIPSVHTATGLAARYTEDQPAGFDVFLPPWPARNSKRIFGTLLVAGEAYLLWLAGYV